MKMNKKIVKMGSNRAINIEGDLFFLPKLLFKHYERQGLELNEVTVEIELTDNPNEDAIIIRPLFALPEYCDEKARKQRQEEQRQKEREMFGL